MGLLQISRQNVDHTRRAMQRSPGSITSEPGHPGSIVINHWALPQVCSLSALLTWYSHCSLVLTMPSHDFQECYCHSICATRMGKMGLMQLGYDSWLQLLNQLLLVVLALDLD